MDFFDWDTTPRILFFAAVFLVAMIPALWQLWLTVGAASPRVAWMIATGVLWAISFAPVVIGSSIFDAPSRTWFNVVCWVGLGAAVATIASATLFGFLADHSPESALAPLPGTMVAPVFPSPEPIVAQTMANPARQSASAVKADAYLFVKSGPDTGKQFPLLQAATIGRSSSCDITLDDRRVSTEHAQVKQSGGQFVFTDLQSTNGSFLLVAGREEPIRSAQVLVDGDAVRVGHTVFEFVDSRKRGTK